MMVVGMMVANRPGNTTIGVTAGMRTTRMTRKMMPGAAGAKEICHRLHLHNTSLHLSNMPGARARAKRLHSQSEQHALSATVHMVAKMANIAKAKANHNPVANMARARASMATVARARTKPSLSLVTSQSPGMWTLQMATTSALLMCQVLGQPCLVVLAQMQPWSPPCLVVLAQLRPKHHPQQAAVSPRNRCHRLHGHRQILGLAALLPLLNNGLFQCLSTLMQQHYHLMLLMHLDHLANLAPIQKTCVQCRPKTGRTGSSTSTTLSGNSVPCIAACATVLG